MSRNTVYCNEIFLYIFKLYFIYLLKVNICCFGVSFKLDDKIFLPWCLLLSNVKLCMCLTICLRKLR